MSKASYLLKEILLSSLRDRLSKVFLFVSLHLLKQKLSREAVFNLLLSTVKPTKVMSYSQHIWHIVLHT